MVVDRDVDGTLEQGGSVDGALRALLHASGVAYSAEDVDAAWVDRAAAHNWRGLAVLDCRDYRHALTRQGVTDLSPAGNGAPGCLEAGLVRFGLPLDAAGQARGSG